MASQHHEIHANSSTVYFTHYDASCAAFQSKITFDSVKEAHNSAAMLEVAAKLKYGATNNINGMAAH